MGQTGQVRGMGRTTHDQGGVDADQVREQAARLMQEAGVGEALARSVVNGRI